MKSLYANRNFMTDISSLQFNLSNLLTNKFDLNIDIILGLFSTNCNTIDFQMIM